MRKVGCGVSLFLLVCSALFGLPRYIIQTGHTGLVTGIEYHGPLKAVVTAGQDGSVKVWETENFSAVHSQTVAPRSIALLAVHPLKPYYAVVFEKDGTYLLAVWDWAEHRELYSLVFADKPLFIDFSPRGTYLAVCLENWKSLALYDALKGSPAGGFGSGVGAGFGIVSYVAFSSKETTILTYQPSGKIIYWELMSSKKVSEVKTLAGLEPLALSENKVHMICRRGASLMFIDALSGKPAGELEVPGLVSARADRRGKYAVFFCRLPGNHESVKVFALNGKTANEFYAVPLLEAESFTVLSLAHESVFAGNSRGDLYWVQRSSITRVVQNNMKKISDIALTDNRLVLGLDRELVEFQSDFLLTGKVGAPEPTPILVRTMASPFPGDEVGLAFHGKKGLFVWNRTGVGGLSLIDTANGAPARQLSAFNSPLEKLVVRDETFLTIEQNGVCRVNRLEDGSILYQHSAVGLHTAAFRPPSRIICGKSRLSSYESPLAVIEGDTGETSFLTDAADIIYDLIFDEKNNILYYLAFEKREGVLVTVIKYRSGDALKYEKTLFTRTGQFFNSAIAFDAARGWLFFSFGENLLYVWDGLSVKALEASPRPIMKIVCAGSAVYALHADCSITAWDSRNTLILFHLYVFENSAWLVVTRDGFYFSEGDVDRYRRVAEAGGDEKALLEKYRLNLEVVRRGKDSP